MQFIVITLKTFERYLRRTYWEKLFFFLENLPHLGNEELTFLRVRAYVCCV